MPPRRSARAAAAAAAATDAQAAAAPAPAAASPSPDPPAASKPAKATKAAPKASKASKAAPKAAKATTTAKTTTADKKAATKTSPPTSASTGNKRARKDQSDDDADEIITKVAKKDTLTPPAADAKDASKGTPQPAADGQKAKKGMVIPVDDYCPFKGEVHIADDGMIYDASLNQSNASNNNNKFYRVQVLGDGKEYKCWTRWGRVGEAGQNALLGSGDLPGAITWFLKKFKDKSGLKWEDRLGKAKPGKYTFIERSYVEDSDAEDDDDAEDGEADDAQADVKPAESKLDPSIQSLMGFIFNQSFMNATMSHLNYDANKLPLGKLSKTTLTRGFQALKDLAALLDAPSPAAFAQQEYGLAYASAVEHVSNQFYSLIPHAFGRSRPPIISTVEMLKKEIELLESLGDMKEAASIMKQRATDDMNQADRQFQALGMEEMSVVSPKSDEYDLLRTYLVDTLGKTHQVRYEVQDIFRIERQGEKARFESSEYANIPSDRRLLWHGSRTTNFGGILSQGLRIAPPEAPATGYMFGKGIYLADMSSKSANYCCSYLSGGEGLLLLCEAELGDPMQKLYNASYNAGDTAKQGGMHSTLGLGTTEPCKWMDAECVHPSLKGIQMPDTKAALPARTRDMSYSCLAYNEYIVYDVRQVRLRYLLRVRM